MFNLRIEYELRPTYNGERFVSELESSDGDVEVWREVLGGGKIDPIISAVTEPYAFWDDQDNELPGPGPLAPSPIDCPDGESVAAWPERGMDEFYNYIPYHSVLLSQSQNYPTLTYSTDVDMPSNASEASEASEVSETPETSGVFPSYLTLAPVDSDKLLDGLKSTHLTNPITYVEPMAALQYRYSSTTELVHPDLGPFDSETRTVERLLGTVSAVDYVFRMRVFNRNTGAEMFWLDTRLTISTPRVEPREEYSGSDELIYDGFRVFTSRALDPAFSEVFSSNIWNKLGNSAPLPGGGATYLGVPVISMSDFVALYGDTSKPSVWESRPSLYEVEE